MIGHKNRAKDRVAKNKQCGRCRNVQQLKTHNCSNNATQITPEPRNCKSCAKPATRNTTRNCGTKSCSNKAKTAKSAKNCS